MRLPIVGGPLRGRWWRPESGGKVLRVLGGSYEPEQTALFEALVREGDTVLDVGAHVGYYTLLASVLVGGRGAVFAFEPNPANARHLRRHVEMNGLGNVEVVEAAVSDRTGTAFFEHGSGTGTGHLVERGVLEVRTVTVDEFAAERSLSPSAMKVDVEGAELGVLEGARETLRDERPVLFLSTHGDGVHRACLDLLRTLGYALRPILGDDLATTREVLCLPAERAGAAAGG